MNMNTHADSPTHILRRTNKQTNKQTTPAKTKICHRQRINATRKPSAKYPGIKENNRIMKTVSTV